jgi:hypothetical protein
VPRAVWQPNPLLVNAVFITAVVVIALLVYAVVQRRRRGAPPEPSEPVVEAHEPEPIDERQYAAGALIYNLLVFPDWVSRRVETFELLGSGWTRRRVSLDFALPAELRGFKVTDVLDAIPVTLMKKGSLLAFDIWDEDARPLPVASTAQGVALGQAALLAVAEGLLGGQPAPEIQDDLRAIAGGNLDRVRAHLEPFELAADPVLRPAFETAVAAIGPHPAATAWRQRLALTGDRTFQGVLRDLSENYLLLVDAKPEPDKRRIFKFVYEHDVEQGEATARRWLATRLGWTATQFGFRTPAANKARSYHCEIGAPPELEITTARLLAGGDKPVDEQLGLRTVAHLHTARLPLHEGAAKFVVSMRSTRVGFLRPAMLIGLFTCLLLWAGRNRLPELARQAEAASTFLVLVPGLLAAYLAQPGEHEVASSLRSGVRIALVVSGACAVVAGGLLVASLRQDVLRFAWTAVSILSTFLFLLLLLAALLPIARREPPRQARGLPL